MRRALFIGATLAALMGHQHAGAIPPDLDIAEGDFNLDGVVDSADLAICIANQGAHNNFDVLTNEYCAQGNYVTVMDGDLDRDGDVDLDDLSELTAHLGTEDAKTTTIAGVDVTGNYDATSRRLEMFDGSTQILGWSNGNVRRLWSGTTGDLQPTVSSAFRKDGVDLTFEYDNSPTGTTSTPPLMSHGSISIGGFMFDGDVDVRRFVGDSAESTLNIQLNHLPGTIVRPVGGDGEQYPRRKYSATTTLRGTIDGVGYVIGISVHYPILEYLHNYNEVVDLYLDTPGRGSQNYWMTRINMNQGTERWDRGKIQPGEQRTYKVCVRVMREDAAVYNEWLRLFTPYRRYFKKLYGDVAYQRDREPIRQFTLSSEGRCSSDPWGFSEPNPAGPNPIDDLSNPTGGGWTDVKKALNNSEISKGFKRHVMWRPSGTFCDAPEPTDCVGNPLDDPSTVVEENYSDNNMPFLFTSNWERIARETSGAAWQSHDILDTQAELEAWVATPGSDRSLGLWWGRSVEVMSPCGIPHFWLPLDVHDLDPCNDDDRDRAYAELDGAGGIGTNTIGLDFTNQIGSWHVYFWVKQMQARHPYKYCTEPLQSDFIHTMTPNYLLMVEIEDGPTPYSTQRGANVMMDFLNPCHETWAMIKRAPDSGIPDEIEVTSWMTEAAASGYTPLISKNVSMPNLNQLPNGLTREHVLAGTPWEITVPIDLATPCGCCNN